MKVTNGEIWATQEALLALSQEELPVGVSYQIAQLIRKVREQAEIIGEVRTGLFRKYAEADKSNPANMTIKPEDSSFAPFIGEQTELFGKEIEIEFEKVKVPDVGLKIKPASILVLEPFVEFELPKSA